MLSDALIRIPGGCWYCLQTCAVGRDRGGRSALREPRAATLVAWCQACLGRPWCYGSSLWQANAAQSYSSADFAPMVRGSQGFLSSAYGFKHRNRRVDAISKHPSPAKKLKQELLMASRPASRNNTTTEAGASQAKRNQRF